VVFAQRANRVPHVPCAFLANREQDVHVYIGSELQRVRHCACIVRDAGAVRPGDYDVIDAAERGISDFEVEDLHRDVGDDGVGIGHVKLSGASVESAGVSGLISGGRASVLSVEVEVFSTLAPAPASAPLSSLFVFS
jgi:hypothetical protein